MNDATAEQLSQYELIDDGSVISWPALDEDLSLKGFLKDELRQTVSKEKNNIAV